MRTKDGKEWQAICRATGNIASTVRVVTKVAREVEISDAWAGSCVEWVMACRRRVEGEAKRSFSYQDGWIYWEASLTLTILTPSIRYQSNIPAILPQVLDQVKFCITTSDISVLSQALSLLAVLLELAPTTTFPAIEREVLGDIYPIAHSPLVSGVALGAFLAFFSALVQADLRIATHVVPNVVIKRKGLMRT